MPKYAVIKAMKVLLQTTNNRESQLVWWCFGHDCVVRSQGNPSVPLLPVLLCGLKMETWYNCKQCWPFGECGQWISKPPSHLFKFLYWATRMYRKKAVCVTNFTWILLDNRVYVAASVSVSFYFGCQNYLAAGYFCYIFGNFETFLVIFRVWRQIFKKDRVCH